MFSRRTDCLVKCLLVFLFVLLIAACGGEAPATPAGGGCSYSLPYPSYLGSVQVSQGNSNPDNSHLPGDTLEYAFDFDLNAGDPVLTSRHGWVAEVHDGETACGGRERINDANYVIVDHRDGTYASYLHLQAGIPVREGQEVWPDKTVVGYVGNTGYTNCQTSAGGGYHLHFQVQDGPEVGDQSLPICFSDVPGNGIPVEGRAYQSQNQIVMVQGMQVTREPSGGEYADLLGTWEGQVSGVMEGGEGSSPESPLTSFEEVRRVRITEDCPGGITTTTCLQFFWWESGNSEYFAYKGEGEEGYCYWQPIDLPGYPEAFVYEFCFRMKQDGSLDYFGTGPLWGEGGILHRISSDGENSEEKPAIPLDPRDANSVIEWLVYALRRGDISVFEQLTRDQTIGYGSGFAGGRFDISRSDFLEMLRERLGNGAVCRGYTGDSEYLTVWTSGWDPHWEDNRSLGPWATDELVLSFFNNGRGLSLTTAYATPSAAVLEVVEHSLCPGN